MVLPLGGRVGRCQFMEGLSQHAVDPSPFILLQETTKQNHSPLALLFYSFPSDLAFLFLFLTSDFFYDEAAGAVGPLLISNFLFLISNSNLSTKLA